LVIQVYETSRQQFLGLPDPDLLVRGSVADPDPGSGAFLTPGSGMGRKSASRSGIRDEQPGSYFLELRNHFFGVKIHKFFDGDPGSGMETVRSRDPGWKKSDAGSGFNIPDPQHWSEVQIRIRILPSSSKNSKKNLDF
jgi:hypothetical protein